MIVLYYMADEHEIADQRKRLAGKSRADLLHEQRRWQPFAPAAIAATQLLDELNSAEEEKRHSDTVAIASRANKLSLFAIFIAILALAVVVFQALLQWHDSPVSKSEVKLLPPLPSAPTVQSTNSVTPSISTTTVPHN